MSPAKLWRQLDKTLVITTIALVLVGFLFIGSATHINVEGFKFSGFVEKQGFFFLINVAFASYLLRYDYRLLRRWVPALYIANILILVAVMVVGVSSLGAQRWIQLGPISLQPSEFAKVVYIICLARFMETRKGQFNNWRNLIPVVLFMLPPTVLIFLQPDLGTSLVFAAITLGVLFLAGADLRIFKQILLGGFALLPLVWFFFLKEYQKKRLLVLFNPTIDPYESGYHVIQSKIAIGSGGFLGKGLFAGTQSQLNFLPENHTDFIFAVLGEELGFVGVLTVLFLYFILFYRSVVITRSAQDIFGRFIGAGIVFMWLFQLFVNVGMTIGLMPVTGIPLPFLSYGVSALTTNLFCVGLLLNIHVHRKKMMF